jgi:uncharacterized Zn finger protein
MLLAEVSPEKLLSLFMGALKQQPHLIDWVAAQLAPPAPAVKQPYQRRTPINPASFVQQLEALLPDPRRKRGRYSSEEYYGLARNIASGMEELLKQVTPFLEAGDGNNALIILEAIISKYIVAWLDYDDSNGDLSEVFASISLYLAEAMLQAELTLAERYQWNDKIHAWVTETDKYGVADVWQIAVLAAEQGWDYPPLRKVLVDGIITSAGVWADEAHVPYGADELAHIRLRVLARQGRTTEYLRLAEAEGKVEAYLAMLVQLGRAEEAINYAHLGTADEVLSLAQALQRHNMPKEALVVAERGLSLYEPYNLAKWLTDMAAQQGSLALALLSAKVAFRKMFTLADYQRAKALAGQQWAELKPELLKALAESNSRDKVKIYVAERMIDEAIQVVDKSTQSIFEGLSQLIDIATPTHPDWVIKVCCQRAEMIIDKVDSKSYAAAADWVKRAKQTYLQANREAEWRIYLADLMMRHQRKHTLLPLLEKLR